MLSSGCVNTHEELPICTCPQRTAVPQRPAVLPFEPIPANNIKMRNWLLDRYASSTFNTCPHRPLQHMKGPPIEIHLDEEEAKPRVFNTAAPIPLHWQQQVKDDLDRDVALGVIERVPYGIPVTWCHRMVVTRKNDGSPRRTVDLSPLNRYCKREVHYGESPFTLARRVPGNTWKSVTDAWNGYHSVPLRQSDRHLTTFITPFGRFRYTRAPQGFLSSGDGYNRRFQAILSDFERKERCVDDTLFYDDNLASHWWRMIDFLSNVGSSGVVLNPDKLQFAKRTVNFAGFQISETNIVPLPKYIDAIQTFPVPNSTTDIRSWFGLINQASNYGQLRDVMTPFRKFLSHKQKFYWDDELNKAFENSKATIVDMIREGVRIFDAKKPTCLRPDWSSRGLGYFLMQKHCGCYPVVPDCCEDGWRITLAGSRFLSDTEKRYAAIEGEALAIVWSLEQTKYFTMGCNDLMVVTDHKPLTKIFADRTLDEIPNPRLFRLKQRTLPWAFRILYMPGSTNTAADAASRHPCSPTTGVNLFCFSDTEETAIIATIMKEAEEVTAISWSTLVRETNNDSVLQSLKLAIIDDFTKECREVGSYVRYRGSLRVHDDVILYGDRVVVPSSLREAVLVNLHAAHQGILSMEMRAQSIVFWPGMSYDIERVRRECSECNKNAPSQARLPSEPVDPPTTPFEKIFADFFEFGGNHYLVIGDRLSGWTEIYPTPSGSQYAGSRGLIRCLRLFFTSFGVPQELASDGGPEFRADSTVKFLRQWDVKQRISSAYFPESNGRAEVAVKTVKRLLRSNIGPSGSLNNDKFLRAMLQLRNTPDPDCNMSPAEIIFGRPLKDTFSFANRAKNSSTPKMREEWRDVWSKKEVALRKRFARWSERIDEHAKKLRPLTVGSKCFIQNQTGPHKKRWDRSGTVMEVLPHNQYTVKVDGSGHLTRRNRQFLRQFAPATTTIERPIVEGPPDPEINVDSTAPRVSVEDSDVVQNGAKKVVMDTTEAKLPLMVRRIQPFNKLGLKEVPIHEVTTRLRPRKTGGHEQ